MMASYLELIKSLVEKVLSIETKRHQEAMNQLIDENDTFVGRYSDGFNYLGVNYGRGGRYVRNCPQLSLKLVYKLSPLLAFQKTVEFDRQMITQGLVKLVEPCQSLQDVRDALPECVVALDDYLGTSYTRTRQPAWCLQIGSREMRMYEKALQKINGYLAMQLLY